MSEDAEAPSPPIRIPTGIRGLDTILGGGLWKGGIYVVTGHPGAGKTTFGNQMSFRYVADGGRAVYVTLLSETHARMLFQIQSMTFCRPEAVGSSLIYLNGFSTIEAEGLDGLLRMVRQSVRDQRAGLLVLDGMVTAGTLARTGIDYKKFINELQTWVGVVGCTVLFLTSGGTEPIAQPENSMVDGIFELQSRRWNLQCARYLSVAKFRGSAFHEGAHSYLITREGIVVYPRIEESERPPPAVALRSQERASTGDGGLDRVMGGGLRRGTSTLLLGPPGSGKTSAGLQFLGAGLGAGEPAVYFGFVEPPGDILARGETLARGFRDAAEGKRLAVHWSSPAEALADKLGHEVLDSARKLQAKRVFIDGLFGFRNSGNAERLGAFIEAINNQLAALGATTLISDEISEMPTPVADSLTSTVSAFTDNIVLLQNLNTGLETARLLTVLKTRQSSHDPRCQRYQLDGSGLRVLEAIDSPPTPELGALTDPTPRRRPARPVRGGKGGKRRPR
jgi:circadian clock protein KaiC